MNDNSLAVKHDNKAMDSKVDYHALEQQRADALQEQLKIKLRRMEAGRSDSLRRAVLRYVAEGKYKEASALLDEYLEMKSHFPGLRERCQVHINHAKELVNAVRAKRNFQKLSQLTNSKQQEILDRAVIHFQELKHTLKAIENLVRDEAVKDIRSTVWVMRSFVYAVTAIVVTVFILEFNGSLGTPFWIIFNNFIDRSYKFMMHYISFL